MRHHIATLIILIVQQTVHIILVEQVIQQQWHLTFGNCNDSTHKCPQIAFSIEGSSRWYSCSKSLLKLVNALPPVTLTPSMMTSAADTTSFTRPSKYWYSKIQASQCIDKSNTAFTFPGNIHFKIYNSSKTIKIASESSCPTCLSFYVSFHHAPLYSVRWIWQNVFKVLL